MEVIDRCTREDRGAFDKQQQKAGRKALETHFSVLELPQRREIEKTGVLIPRRIISGGIIVS